MPEKDRQFTSHLKSAKMKVFVLMTCCLLSLIIGISDSRTPSSVPCTTVPCTPARIARECSDGTVYATCYMRQKGDDDSGEDSRGDDDDDDDVADDDGRGDDGGRDDDRGSRNASRRRGDDDGGDDDGDGGIRGSVYFSQKVDDSCNPLEELKVRVRIRGLGGDDDDNRRRGDDDDGGEECDDDGCRRTRLHGIHIHKYGDLRNECLAAGPHYNPTEQDHGDRRGSPRHLGDMGNVRSNRFGRIRHDFRVEETAIIDILGRAVVLHAGRDDLGRGGNSESLLTGNSGARLACCVIGFANHKEDKPYG